MQTRAGHLSPFAGFYRISFALASSCIFMLMVFSVAGDVVHYQLLKSFGSVTNDGRQPWAPLVQGRDGALYGTTYLDGSNGYGTVFKLSLDGGGYAILHHFGAGAADGRSPLGAVLFGSDGLLYGTTSAGGSVGAGTIFKMQSDGSGYTVMRSFAGSVDGSEPDAALIEGSDGALYGTAYSGPGYFGPGTAFAIKKDGTGFRVVHHFGLSSIYDGSQPYAPLLEGSDGALYGTTSGGGDSGVGSVFKVNKDATGYQTLCSVLNPYAGLLEGSDHALYGAAGGGFGGVFKVNKDGTGLQFIHGFNGDRPFAALVKGRDGALYSTTNGDPPGGGTAFRLNEDGSGFETLHIFGEPDGDGRNPECTMFLATNGAFYGTTLDGGAFGRGAVYRLLVNRIPVVQCADVVVSADSGCAANASVDHGSFDPDGDPITLVQSPLGPYPLGTNRVTLIVTDSNGDSNYCTASVIVLDTTPPRIACASNTIVEFTSDAGALVTYTVSSTDNCDPNPAVTSVPPSGSLFPIGTTEVQSTATDASGNQASCAFSVTVVGARGVKQDVLAELVALRASILCSPGIDGGNPSGNDNGAEGTNGNVCQKLDEAIRHLRVALSPDLWVDEKHVQSRHGELVFDEEDATVGLLCQLVHLPSSGLPDALLQGFIARLNRADRLLALVAIQDASAAGVATQRIVQAQKFLAEGDADAAVDPCGDTITDYRQAWKHATRPQVSLPIGLPNGHTQLELLAEPGARVTVQASTNLVDWVTLGTATASGDGVLQFEDIEAANHALRYYRAVSP